MLDSQLPSTMFSGKDDLYSLVRETRAYINYLETKIENLEARMSNTQSNPVLRPNIQTGRGRPKKNVENS